MTSEDEVQALDALLGTSKVCLSEPLYHNQSSNSSSKNSQIKKCKIQIFAKLFVILELPLTWRKDQDKEKADETKEEKKPGDVDSQAHKGKGNRGSKPHCIVSTLSANYLIILCFTMLGNHLHTRMVWPHYFPHEFMREPNNYIGGQVGGRQLVRKVHWVATKMQ